MVGEERQAEGIEQEEPEVMRCGRIQQAQPVLDRPGHHCRHQTGEHRVAHRVAPLVVPGEEGVEPGRLLSPREVQVMRSVEDELWWYQALRAHVINSLPSVLPTFQLLDAGCGTGVQSVELAQRGATVVAIDLSPTLVGLAEARSTGKFDRGTIEWRSGDMLDAQLGSFDYVVAMDSLIHYRMADMLDAYAALAARTRIALAVTFAPSTPLLATVKAIGGLFPRRNRAPAIEPVKMAALLKGIARDPRLALFEAARTHRVESGFYTSQALELRRRVDEARP